MQVRDGMSQIVLQVGPGHTLREAARQMSERKVGAAVVHDPDAPGPGIITERDILMKILGRDIQPGEPVDTFMRRDPDTLTLDHTVGDALHLMDNGRYRTLPLVDADGVIEGILRQQDILEYVAEAFPQEILNLPPRPHQIAEEPEGA